MITPEGYISFSKPRDERKGGGIAIICQNEFSQYESGGTFFIGFIIEYLEKLNAIILIIYSSQPFNVVCEHQVFALRGSD